MPMTKESLDLVAREISEEELALLNTKYLRRQRNLAAQKHRDDIRNAVREILLSEPLNIADIVHEVKETAKERIINSVVSQIAEPEWLNTKLAHLVGEIVKRELGGDPKIAIRGALVERIKQDVNKFVSDNILVKVKEGGEW